MRKIRERIPSPAMIVACLALTVALSGAGYAAVTLPRNSVGTVQLKKFAVAAKKIKLVTSIVAVRIAYVPCTAS